MAQLERRLQLLLSDAQYAFVSEQAQKQRCSVAEAIRRAIEKQYAPHSNYQSLLVLQHLQENYALLRSDEWQEITKKMQ